MPAIRSREDDEELEQLIRKGYVDPFATEEPEEISEPIDLPEDTTSDAIASLMKPTGLEVPRAFRAPTALEGLQEQYNAQPTTKQKILRAIVPAAGLAIAGAFGGAEGLSGAAQGINATMTEQAAAEQRRKDTLLQQIEAEKARQERAAQNQAAMQRSDRSFAEQVRQFNESQKAAKEATGQRGGFSLSPGQTQYDASGRVIASLPTKPEVASKPSVDQQMMDDWIRKNPGAGPSDYLVWKNKQENANRAQIQGISPMQFNRVQILATQYDNNPAVKDYDVAANNYATVKSILSGTVGGPQDLATVYLFMKALDPTSVVRESEYESAAKSGNIFAGAYARFNGYLKPGGGFLPPQVRSAFLNILKKKMDASTIQVSNMYKDFGRRIEKITGQPGGVDYLTDHTSLVGDMSATEENTIPKVGGTFNGEKVLKVTKVK